VSRAVQLTTIGPEPSLATIEVPDSGLEPGRTLVAFAAAEVAPIDVQIATGQIPGVPPPPLLPGGTAAGTVLESAVHPAGTLVYVSGGPHGMGTRTPGTFAEVVHAPDDAVFPLPELLDPETAAAGVSSATAARYALVDHAAVQQGETVLVLGATGAVGSAAIQLAVALGAKVLAAARRPDRVQSGPGVQAFSFDGFADAVAETTEGVGVAAIVDTVGGPYMEESIRSGGPRCRHVVLGYTAGTDSTVNLPLMSVKEHRLLGMNTNRPTPERRAQLMGEVLHDLAEGRVQPRIGERFPLSAAADAYRADGSAGRILLVAG
jgi:NADPH:quinone reductase